MTVNPDKDAMDNRVLIIRFIGESSGIGCSQDFSSESNPSPSAMLAWVDGPVPERCRSRSAGIAPHRKTGPDISRADFTFRMTAIDWGWSVEATAQRLMEESTTAQENGERICLHDCPQCRRSRGAPGPARKFDAAPLKRRGVLNGWTRGIVT